MRSFVMLAAAALMVVIGILAYHQTSQKTPAEKRAELQEVLMREDVISKLGEQGLLTLWNFLTPEQQQDLTLRQIKKENLLQILGKEDLDLDKAELLLVKSDGQYDSDYDLVDLTGSKPSQLSSFQRRLLIEAYGQEKEYEGALLLSEETALGVLYSQENIFTTIQVFDIAIDTPFGSMPLSLLEIPDISLRFYLLPDPNQEPELTEQNIKEELGGFRVNPGLNIVVIKRINPVINTPTEFPVSERLPKDFLGPKASYGLMFNESRVEVQPLFLLSVHTDSLGRNLISVSGAAYPNSLGGLVFAIRDGKPVLVGLVSVLQKNNLYALDIRQILAYIEKEKGNNP